MQDPGGRERETHHVVSQGGISLTTTAQAAEGVEHARAHEADEGHEDELELGRGVPSDLLAEVPLLVHPSRGQADVARGVVDDGVVAVRLNRLGLDGGRAGGLVRLVLLLCHGEAGGRVGSTPGFAGWGVVEGEEKVEAGGEREREGLAGGLRVGRKEGERKKK